MGCLTTYSPQKYNTSICINKCAMVNTLVYGQWSSIS